MARRARRQEDAPGRSLPALSLADRARAWPGLLADELESLLDAVRGRPWRIGVGQIVLIGLALIGLVAFFSVTAIYASGAVLPGVSVAGIGLDGLSEADAVVALREGWSQRSLILRDGERTWEVTPAQLGFQIDAEASARRAVRYGREQGGLSALVQTALQGVDLEPVIEFDLNRMWSGLLHHARLANVPAQNASLQVQGVIVTHIGPQSGRRLDVKGLALALAVDPVQVVSHGVIDLPMMPVDPVITDARPLVEYAQNLIQRPLILEAYDPVSDQAFPMSVPPERWGQWLDTRLVYHRTGPRLYLSLSAAPARQYLEEQARNLPEPLTLDFDQGVEAMQQAVANGTLNTWVTARHLPTVHTVQRGETAYSISRTQGIPFYLIEQANPDRDLSELYVGDEIILPSRDIMLPLRPVRGKRIVVDLSDQYMWAYENGRVVYEWAVSTGISSAPTSAGIFQILSHEERAYGSSFELCEESEEGTFSCGQWVMHWFMGIYEVIPGLMNGFHGAVELPNGGYLGGGQVGRPYTYGCIMAVEENAIQLYNWAEEGVIVEIRQ